MSTYDPFAAFTTTAQALQNINASQEDVKASKLSRRRGEVALKGEKRREESGYNEKLEEYSLDIGSAKAAQSRILESIYTDPTYQELAKQSELSGVVSSIATNELSTNAVFQQMAFSEIQKAKALGTPEAVRDALSNIGDLEDKFGDPFTEEDKAALAEAGPDELATLLKGYDTWSTSSLKVFQEMGMLQKESQLAREEAAYQSALDTVRDTNKSNTDAANREPDLKSVIDRNGKVVGSAMVQNGNVLGYNIGKQTQLGDIPEGLILGGEYTPGNTDTPAGAGRRAMKPEDIVKGVRQIRNQLSTTLRTASIIMNPELEKVVGTIQGPFGKAFPILENLILNDADEATKAALMKQTLDNVLAVARSLAPVNDKDVEILKEEYMSRELTGPATRMLWLKEMIPSMLDKIENYHLANVDDPGSPLASTPELAGAYRAEAAARFFELFVSQPHTSEELIGAVNNWFPTDQQVPQGTGEYVSFANGKVMPLSTAHALAYKEGFFENGRIKMEEFMAETNLRMH